MQKISELRKAGYTDEQIDALIAGEVSKATGKAPDMAVNLEAARKLALSIVKLDKGHAPNRYGVPTDAGKLGEGSFRLDEASFRRTAHRCAAYCGLDISPITKITDAGGKNPHPYPDALFAWIKKAKARTDVGGNIAPQVLAPSTPTSPKTLSGKAKAKAIAEKIGRELEGKGVDAFGNIVKS